MPSRPESCGPTPAQNREKLLTAAAELFASSGVEVSLQAVADRAGVGIGTLYRDFPTRNALVEATYRNEVERLCDAAAELQRTRPPEVALAEWMDRFVTCVAAKRGMADALQSITASNAQLYPRTRTQLLDAITSLLENGAASGGIRADVEPEDVLQAMNAVWLFTDEAHWQDRAHRILGLLMDGLRHRGGRRADTAVSARHNRVVSGSTS